MKCNTNSSSRPAAHTVLGSMNATPTVAATHTVPGSMNATPTFGAGCIPFDEVQRGKNCNS